MFDVMKLLLLLCDTFLWTEHAAGCALLCAEITYFPLHQAMKIKAI